MDYNSERQKLRQQLQDLNRQQRQEQAAANRVEVQNSMTPDQLKAQAANDALTASVFDNANGTAYLAYLKAFRPIVYDEIQEAIKRYKGVSGAATKPATG